VPAWPLVVIICQLLQLDLCGKARVWIIFPHPKENLQALELLIHPSNIIHRIINSVSHLLDFSIAILFCFQLAATLQEPCLPHVRPSDSSRDGLSLPLLVRFGILFKSQVVELRMNLYVDFALSQSSKVTVLGAAGGIGQPLSLLMKLNPRISQLALYDIRGGPGKADKGSSPTYNVVLTGYRIAGVAADLSHINTNNTVSGYDPTPSGLREALNGSDIVLIPAGVPRKPGMTRDGME
jgi:lactate/malate dehydrogenase, NAD binding domain